MEHGSHHGDFDERAATWDDDPTKVERSAVAADAIRRLVPLTAATRLLEYGAGTGLLSQALQGDVGPITLVDTSAGMREVMAAKVADGRLPAGTRIWDLDLASRPAPPEQVDVVATVLALHHVEDVDAVLRGLAALLVDGGHLCVVDLDREDGSFHGQGFGGHHGFDRAELAARMGRAGFVDVTVQDCFPITREDGVFGTFLAVGVRRP